MMDKNSVFTGLVLGAVVPVLGYIMVEFIFGIMTQMGMMEFVSGTGTSRRMRTLALMGICCNLIPFHISRRNKWDDTMRGIVFPTLLYVGYWLYKFGPLFF